MSGAAGLSAPGRIPLPKAVVLPFYVWEAPVRLIHWLIAGSIVVLGCTGFYIGHPFITVPGEAREQFVTGLVRAVHFYAVIVFTLSVLSRIVWMFAGNYFARWHQFVPVHRRRRRRLLHTLSFYLFLRRDPPEVVGHNPLAGATYTLLYLIYLGMIGTGLAMYAAYASVHSPMRWFTFLIPLAGGLQSAHWLHHVGMWLIIAFVPHHIASALLVSRIERAATMESIFSGYKFVRPEQVRDHLEDTAR